MATPNSATGGHDGVWWYLTGLVGAVGVLSFYGIYVGLTVFVVGCVWLCVRRAWVTAPLLIAGIGGAVILGGVWGYLYRAHVRADLAFIGVGLAITLVGVAGWQLALRASARRRARRRAALT
jgi:hypothetical protein